MTAAELKSDFKLTTDTPYLALTRELWGVNCVYLAENLSHYNGTALYILSKWTAKQQSADASTNAMNFCF